MSFLDIPCNFDNETKVITGSKCTVEVDNKNGAGHFFLRTMQKHRNQTAQIDVITGEKDTYASLLQRSVRTAIEMKNRGIKPGDIIGVCTHNHMNTAVPYIASQLIGAIFTAIDITINLSDTKYLLNLVKPKMMFVSTNLIKDAAEELQLQNLQIISFTESTFFESFDNFISPKVGEADFKVYIPDDDLVTTNILFSSGTTGLPKGICLGYNTIVFTGLCLHTVKADDIMLAFSSMYWISSLFLIITAVMNGASRLICPSFDPKKFWSYLEHHKVKYVFLDPTQIIQCLTNVPSNFNYKLRDLLLGGSPITDKYLKLVFKTFPETNVSMAYGQTELGIVTILDDAVNLPENKLNSCGLIGYGTQAKVVNYITGKPLGPNETGEIRVKAEYPMNGYYNADSSACWDTDDFIKTGDLGYYDKDLYFYITDRIKEMFKYLSWHIVPAKIESIVNAHPDIDRAIVVGVPHPEEGNHAMALVTINKNSKITSEEIAIWMDKRLDDRHKLRAGVKIIDGFEYTSTGKIKRNETRDKVLKRQCC